MCRYPYTQCHWAGSLNPRFVSSNPTTSEYKQSTSLEEEKKRTTEGPNWSNEEILALIQAKRILQDEELNRIDKQSLMLLDEKKWHRISHDVMASRIPTTHRDGLGCKLKWNQIIPEF